MKEKKKSLKGFVHGDGFDYMVVFFSVTSFLWKYLPMRESFIGTVIVSSVSSGPYAPLALLKNIPNKPTISNWLCLPASICPILQPRTTTYRIMRGYTWRLQRTLSAGKNTTAYFPATTIETKRSTIVVVPLNWESGIPHECCQKLLVLLVRQSHAH